MGIKSSSFEVEVGGDEDLVRDKHPNSRPKLLYTLFGMTRKILLWQSPATVLGLLVTGADLYENGKRTFVRPSQPDQRHLLHFGVKWQPRRCFLKTACTSRSKISCSSMSQMMTEPPVGRQRPGLHNTRSCCSKAAGGEPGIPRRRRRDRVRKPSILQDRAVFLRCC
jgi:hypothetical protein